MFLFLLIIGLFIDVCHGYLTWSFGGDDDDDYYSGRRYLGGSYGQPTVQQTYGQPFYGQPSYSPVTYSSVNMGGRSAGQCQVIRYLGNQYVDYLRTSYPSYQCYCSNIGYFTHVMRTNQYAACANNLPTNKLMQWSQTTHVTQYTPVYTETTWPYYSYYSRGWGK